MRNRLNRGAMALMAAAAVAGGAGVAAADPIKPGQQQGLGLTGADIPAELKAISADPYAAPGDCQQIKAEIHQLDQILGPDRDSNQQSGGVSTVDTTVVPLVRSFIPYRNLVRIVTGANRKDAELTQAAMAGWERRGFLKGLQKHCGAPSEQAIAAQGQPAADIAPEPAAAAAPAYALSNATPISTAPAYADRGGPADEVIAEPDRAAAPATFAAAGSELDDYESAAVGAPGR